MAYVVISQTIFCVFGVLITSLYLRVKLIQLLQCFLIMDTILTAMIVATLSFIAIMVFLDPGKWEIQVIQVGFTFIAICNTSIFRMALLYAGWKKWQVIVYKIAISIMALSYFCMGIYCFYTNFSFTYHLYIPLDKRANTS